MLHFSNTEQLTYTSILLTFTTIDSRFLTLLEITSERKETGARAAVFLLLKNDRSRRDMEMKGK